MSTQVLILVIAAVTGVSAIVGYALGRQSGVGAGLGLSLVKNFVELHDGDVAIESEPDEGTAIVCRLPRRPRIHEPGDDAE